MKKILITMCCISLITDTIAQKCPEGFHRALYRAGVSRIQPNIDIIEPACDIYACVENKPGLQGQQIFWSVTAKFHNYKYIKFTKRIELTCGNVITKEVELDGMKKDEFRGGGSFFSPWGADLSDNIFKEDCNNPNNRIKSLEIMSISGELYDDDPQSPQWNRKQNEIRKELTDKFNNKLTAARTTLNTIKNNNPDKAANYENTHGAVISQIKNDFQDEVNKGNKADQQRLQGYMISLENETAQLEQISEANSDKKNTSSVTQNTSSGNNQLKDNSYQNNTTNSNSGNNSNNTNTNIQKQQYQNQANTYLNQAQNTNQSSISQNLNLNLAKTNALMAGNSQQVADINKQQSQLTAEANQQLISSGITLASTIFDNIKNQSSWRQKYKQILADANQAEKTEFENLKDSAEAGNPYAMLQLGIDFIYNPFVINNVNQNRKPDYALAFNWLQKAANAGLPEAMMQLYFNRDNFHLSDSLADYWLEKAADAGEPNGLSFMIGRSKRIGSSCLERKKGIAYWFVLDSLERTKLKVDSSDVTNLLIINASDKIDIAKVLIDCGDDALTKRQSLELALQYLIKSKELNSSIEINLKREKKDKYHRIHETTYKYQKKENDDLIESVRNQLKDL